MLHGVEALVPHECCVRSLLQPLAGLLQQLAVVGVLLFGGIVALRIRMVLLPFLSGRQFPVARKAAFTLIFRPVGLLLIISELVALLKCLPPLPFALELERPNSAQILSHLLAKRFVLGRCTRLELQRP